MRAVTPYRADEAGRAGPGDIAGLRGMAGPGGMDAPVDPRGRPPG